MVTKSELIKKLRQSIVTNTNKRGYVDITEETVSDIVTDLEQIINIQYAEEVVSEQLSFDI
jgi:hypothetical protein